MGQRGSLQLKDQGHDNVLPAEGYSTDESHGRPTGISEFYTLEQSCTDRNKIFIIYNDLHNRMLQNMRKGRKFHGHVTNDGSLIPYNHGRIRA
jgi:hypothetical protein